MKTQEKLETKQLQKESNTLNDEAQKYFPGGLQSANQELFPHHHPAHYIKQGEGPHCTDQDGNEYLDFCLSWGDLILGHNIPFVQKHIQEALDSGVAFGSSSHWGNQLGRQIIDNHPFLDQIRFTGSHTEAVMSALRLARGATEKRKVIRFEGCFHGHIDSLMDPTEELSGEKTFTAQAGIPEAFTKKTIVLPLNDLDTLDEMLRTFANDIACAIIEPIPASNGLLLQKRSYLKKLKELCHTYKVLLIFDERKTGFRIGFDGAAGYYNIEPDILVFGHSVGGGLPLGAFGARKDLMKHLAPQGKVLQAGAIYNNHLPMAAGYASLKRFIEPQFYKDLNKKTRQFTKIISNHIKENDHPAVIQSVGSMFWLYFGENAPVQSRDIDGKNNEYFFFFFKNMLENGLYFSPSPYVPAYISEAHTDEQLNSAAETICKGIDEVLGSK